MITGLNNTLCREANEQFVTAVYFYLDAVNMTGRHSAAGHSVETQQAGIGVAR
jgi:hypothetical protein